MLYKTIWTICDNTENITTNFTYYHFGKAPKFPTWYFEENHVYTVEMDWNFSLVITFSTFFKCLFHEYIVK